MSFFVYILYSENHERFYVGQTANLTNRLYRHNNGTEKATAPYRPWKIILSINKPSRSEAVILERKLKNLNRERLLNFIKKYSESGRDAA